MGALDGDDVVSLGTIVGSSVFVEGALVTDVGSCVCPTLVGESEGISVGPMVGPLVPRVGASVSDEGGMV